MCALEPQTYLVIFNVFVFIFIFIAIVVMRSTFFALTIVSIYNICGSVFQDWFSFLSIQMKIHVLIVRLFITNYY